MLVVRFAVVVGAICLCAACAEGPVVPAPPDGPVFGAAALRENASNVLSVSLAVSVTNTDSVALTLSEDGTSGVIVTPAVLTAGDSAVVPVLGLRPLQRYVVRPVAYRSGKAFPGNPIDYTTGALPADLPSFTASGPDPSPGYVVFAAGLYGIVIDNSGRVVWYRRFAGNGPGLTFEAQPNGRYVTRPSTADPTDVEPWVEIDAMGEVTRTLGCANGLQSRPHDMISELDGSYWLMCDETRTMDLTAYAGVASARVTGTSIHHVSSSGALLFQWSPFDHFSITDVAVSERTGSNVNWTHGNALDKDADGNLLVSFRNLDEITKINVSSGDVMWRMGGLRNQFTFPDLAGIAFSHQHGARVVSPGRLILLDNLGNPSESRSESYLLDESARTARLSSSYGSVPSVITQIGGSVQGLPGGRTLVSFGTTGRVEEYDASGRMVWHIEGNPGYVFRAQRITSLYAPGAGTSR